MNDFYPAFSALTGDSAYEEQFSHIRWANNSQTTFLTDRRTQSKLYAYDGYERYNSVKFDQVKLIESSEELDEFISRKIAEQGVKDSEMVQSNVVWSLKKKYFAPRFELPDNFPYTFTHPKK